MSRKLLARPNPRKFFKLSAICEKVRQHRFKPLKSYKNMLASTLGAELKSSPAAPNSCFCKRKRVNLRRKVNAAKCCSRQVRYNHADARRKVESVLLERGHKFISKQLSCNALHQLVKSVDVQSRNLLNLLPHQQCHNDLSSSNASVKKNVSPVVHITSTCRKSSDVSNNKKEASKSFRNFKYPTLTESCQVLLRKNFKYLKPSDLLFSHYFEPQYTGFQLIRNGEEPESFSDSQPSAIYDELFRIAEAKFDIGKRNEDTCSKSGFDDFHVAENVKMQFGDSLLNVPDSVSRTNPPVPSHDPMLGLFGSFSGSDSSLPSDDPLTKLPNSCCTDSSLSTNDQLHLSDSISQTDLPIPSDDPLLGLFGCSTRTQPPIPCNDSLVDTSDYVGPTGLPIPSDDVLVDLAESSFQTEPPIPSDDVLVDLAESSFQTEPPISYNDLLVDTSDTVCSNGSPIPSGDPLVKLFVSSSPTSTPIPFDDARDSVTSTDPSIPPDDPLADMLDSSTQTNPPVLHDDPLLGLFKSGSRAVSPGSPNDPLVDLFRCNQPILPHDPLVDSYGSVCQTNPLLPSNDSLKNLPDTFSQADPSLNNVEFDFDKYFNGQSADGSAQVLIDDDFLDSLLT